MRFLSAMMRTIALASLAGATPALACSYSFAPEPMGGPSAEFIMPRMAAAATYIDIAMAEGASDVRGPDGKVTPWAKAISFRVLQRFKGNSADRFILFGSLNERAPAGQWSMTHWVDDEGRIDPFESVREATIVPPSGMTSCDPPALSVVPGRLYLVHREADGRLLGWVQYHKDKGPRGSTPIADANLWPGIDWARLASGAQYPPGPRSLPQAVRTPEPGRATVRFRRPLTAAAATQLLRSAEALPFAVTLKRGGIVSDYRLGSDFAWLGIVEDAVDWAEKAGTDRRFVKAQAVAVVEAYTVSSIMSDTAEQQLAGSVLRLAEQAGEAGPAMVTAVSVIGTPAVQQRLAGRAEVAEVLPAARVRNRVATAQEAGQNKALPQLSGLEIHRRLTAIAGKNISEGAVIGSWRLVGSYDSKFDEEVMQMTLAKGQLTVSTPCTPPIAGSYRFAGMALEVDLPKQSLKSCPQRSSFWTIGYFLDEKVLTARLSGNALELIGPGSHYRFERAR